jgi:hypothetical protein
MIEKTMNIRFLWACCAVALLPFLTSCADDEVDGKGTPTCAVGEVFNPILGQCGPRPDSNNGTTVNNVDPNNLNPNNSTTTNNVTPGPDMGTETDMEMTSDCEGNERRCVGNTVEICQSGTFVLRETCMADEVCMFGNCVPANMNACTPGATRCAGATAVETCEADGMSWSAAQACGENEECQDGICTQGCAGFIDKKSNVGCEYVTMRHDQATGLRVLPHTVVVSNPTQDPITVDVTSPAGINTGIPQQTIPPNDSVVLNFPTSPMVATAGLTNNIYLIKSSRPVIATQFSPLNNPGIGSETSDASLLLPTNAVGREYVVVGWRSLQPQGTYVDIVALEPNTTVTVQSPKLLSGGAAGNVAAGSTAMFSIPENNVLHLEAGSGFFDTQNREVDGVIITANNPVAVYTGATIVNIPDEPIRANPPAGCAATDASCTANADCCSGLCGWNPQMNTNMCMDSLAAGDHVEQQLFPVESWGSSYVGVPFPARNSNDFTIYRVVGSANGTTVNIDPPLNGVSSFTLDRGEVRQVFGSTAFELTASQPVMVAQFMIGGAISSSDDGDPAFLAPPAVQQYRDSYVFLVPGNYRSNRVTIVKQAGTTITLDGSPVAQSEFTAVGGTSTYEYATINSLSAGVHRATSTDAFGVVVHGVDEYISYAFAGGITLPE